MRVNPNLTTATVEIFHDVECGRLDVEPVLEGIEVVSAIAGRLDVIQHDRLLRISQPGTDSIATDRIRWPRFTADLNIVLTERYIDPKDYVDTNEIVGPQAVGVAQVAASVAIVDTKHALAPKLTSAHELGHLFGLKTEGTWFSKETGNHCRRPDCLMYEESIAYKSVERVVASGAKRLLEATRLRKPEYLSTVKRENDTFCPECNEQLASTGQRRALGKIGIHLPHAGISIRRP